MKKSEIKEQRDAAIAKAVEARLTAEDFTYRLQDMHRRAQRAEGRLAKSQRHLKASQAYGRYWFNCWKKAQDDLMTRALQEKPALGRMLRQLVRPA